MEKYNVIAFILIWYIAALLTGIVFSTGIISMNTTPSVSGLQGLSPMTIFDILKLIFASPAIGYNIPNFPMLLSFIFGFAFYVMLGYFIYLNTPLPLSRNA